MNDCIIAGGRSAGKLAALFKQMSTSTCKETIVILHGQGQVTVSDVNVPINEDIAKALMILDQIVKFQDIENTYRSPTLYPNKCRRSRLRGK